MCLQISTQFSTAHECRTRQLTSQSTLVLGKTTASKERIGELGSTDGSLGMTLGSCNSLPRLVSGAQRTLRNSTAPGIIGLTWRRVGGREGVREIIM